MAFTCSKWKFETLKQCVKYVQSLQYRHQKDIDDVIWWLYF